MLFSTELRGTGARGHGGGRRKTWQKTPSRADDSTTSLRGIGGWQPPERALLGADDGTGPKQGWVARSGLGWCFVAPRHRTNCPARLPDGRSAIEEPPGLTQSGGYDLSRTVLDAVARTVCSRSGSNHVALTAAVARPCL